MGRTKVEPISRPDDYGAFGDPGNPNICGDDVNAISGFAQV